MLKKKKLSSHLRYVDLNMVNSLRPSDVYMRQ